MAVIDIIGDLIGLEITLASRSSITVAPGSVGGIELLSAITKTDSPWASGDGNGGLIKSANLGGTITVSNGGVTVVGTGTSFTADFAVGSILGFNVMAGDYSSTISNVVDDTHLTLHRATSNQTGIAYHRGGSKGEQLGIILITDGVDVDVCISTFNAAREYDVPSGWTGFLIGYVSYSTTNGIITLYTPDWTLKPFNKPDEAVFSGNLAFNPGGSVTVSSINTSTGVITATADHNLVTGQPIVAYSGTWASFTLTNGTCYFARVLSPTTFTLHNTVWEARGVATAIGFSTGGGTGSRVFWLLSFVDGFISYGLDPVAPFVPTGVNDWKLNFLNPYAIRTLRAPLRSYASLTISGAADTDGAIDGIGLPSLFTTQNSNFTDGSITWPGSGLRVINSSNAIKGMGNHSVTFSTVREISVNLLVKW